MDYRRTSKVRWLWSWQKFTLVIDLYGLMFGFAFVELSKGGPVPTLSKIHSNLDLLNLPKRRRPSLWVLSFRFAFFHFQFRRLTPRWWMRWQQSRPLFTVEKEDVFWLWLAAAVISFGLLFHLAPLVAGWIPWL